MRLEQLAGEFESLTPRADLKQHEELMLNFLSS